jgi:hypothetical protein
LASVARNLFDDDEDTEPVTGPTLNEILKEFNDTDSTD